MSNVKLLYELEHHFLPMFIFGSEEKVSNGIYKTLVSKFPSLCVDALKSISEKKNSLKNFSFDEKYFKSECLPSRYIDKGGSALEIYRFLKLYFPFNEFPDYSLLYPCAFVVLCKKNNKNYYYYFTLEYDSMGRDENNHSVYYLCSWEIDSTGNLHYENLGQIKLDVFVVDKIFHTFIDAVYKSREKFKKEMHWHSVSWAPLKFGYVSELTPEGQKARKQAEKEFIGKFANEICQNEQKTKSNNSNSFVSRDVNETKNNDNGTSFKVITIGVILFIIYLLFFASKGVIDIWNWFIVGRY